MKRWEYLKDPIMRGRHNLAAYYLENVTPKPFGSVVEIGPWETPVYQHLTDFEKYNTVVVDPLADDLSYKDEVHTIKGTYQNSDLSAYTADDYALVWMGVDTPIDSEVLIELVKGSNITVLETAANWKRAAAPLATILAEDYTRIYTICFDFEKNADFISTDGGWPPFLSRIMYIILP